MRALLAFSKKEIIGQLRSGKLLILGGIFTLFALMNPAVAKLTPWLMETMSDSLGEMGMTVTAVSVTALDSWVQFFKNIPMALIAFAVLESSCFTREYRTGTLVLSLTKGLERYKVVLAKAVVLTLLWTLGYWLCFGITFLCNEFLWDNSVAQNLLFSGLCWWLLGLWVTLLTVLLSTVFSSNIGVLAGTGGTVLGIYLLGTVPRLGKYLPTFLGNGNALIFGTEEPPAYTPAILITAALCLICFAAAIPVFNKKKL